MKIWFRHGNYS
jgi:serine/threonine-protein kinase mTOR